MMRTTTTRCALREHSRFALFDGRCGTRSREISNLQRQLNVCASCTNRTSGWQRLYVNESTCVPTTFVLDLDSVERFCGNVVVRSHPFRRAEAAFRTQCPPWTLPRLIRRMRSMPNFQGLDEKKHR